MQKKGAARVAAKVKEKLNVTALMEKGKPGELSIYVGDQPVKAPGFFGKALGFGIDGVVAEIGKKLAVAKA
jgi:hypothetical protein